MSSFSSAARTPIGKFQGALARDRRRRSSARSRSGRRASARAWIPRLIAEVFMGNVVQAGEGQAPARQAAIGAGMPPDDRARPRSTRSAARACSAVMLAAAAIRAGDGDFYVAGGMENMNLAPYLLPNAPLRLPAGQRRAGRRRRPRRAAGIRYDNKHMGEFAEWTAETYGISRAGPGRAGPAQPPAGGRRAWTRAASRRRSHPCPCRSARDPSHVRDGRRSPPEHVPQKCSPALKPVFKEGGTVTAGNAPGITDGAAALVVGAARRCRGRGAHAAGPRSLATRKAASSRTRSSSRPSTPSAAVRTARLPPGRLRPGRAQRGVRRAGRGQHPGARPRHGAGQRQRRRDRARPPHRRQRRAGADHAAATRCATAGCDGPGVPVPGRRRGRRAGRGTGMNRSRDRLCGGLAVQPD